MASNSACGGAPMPSSIFTNPMKRAILISPSGWWGVVSHVRRPADGLFDIDFRSFLQTVVQIPVVVQIPADQQEVEPWSAPFDFKCPRHSGADRPGDSRDSGSDAPMVRQAAAAPLSRSR